ncbi:MAG: transporter [Gordonia sp. (in: high G+C Gram-positive bacteria)]|uniref:PH-like domain-containing protein n=1 Tax=Gordonia sp. (in: high G+C Gram-positive bacteria) TaxID=84139 RepID=UPI0039E40617
MSNWVYYLIVAAVVIGLWLTFITLVLRGWRNRGLRQTDLVGDPPPAPADLGEPILGPDTGMYVGSTIAPSWQDRVAVGDFGDRAVVTYSRYPNGILLDRRGASDIWIPEESIDAVRTENGLAGKVMSRDGVLVIRWTLPSGTQIDSGIRGDDRSVYPAWTEPYEAITQATHDALAANDRAQPAKKTKRKKK